MELLEVLQMSDAWPALLIIAAVLLFVIAVSEDGVDG